MAISFVGSAENSAAEGGDVTLTLPVGTAANDLVIVAGAIGDGDGVDFTMAMVTSGYTSVADLHADDTSDCDLGVFYKFMGATPDTTAVFDGQGGTDSSEAAVCHVWRGVDLTTPLDVTTTTNTGISSSRADPPSIDWSTSGVVTIAVGACSHRSGAAVSFTAPTNYENLVDIAADDTEDVLVGMASRSDPSDPEDPGVFTPSFADNTNHSWCAATLALRPAAVGGAAVKHAMHHYKSMSAA